MAFTEQEISEFQTEAFELLDSAEKSLLALDGGATDFQGNYDAIFRCFHSLKGAAGMMEFSKLQAHMHQLESTFIGFKDKGGIPKAHCDFFLRGVDAAKLILVGQEAHFDATVPGQASAPAPHVPAPAPQAAAPIVPPSQEPPSDMPQVSDATLAEFVSECEEISSRVSLNFGLIEKGGYSHEVIDSIYRDIHSLKGSSQLFGYKQMGELGHAMESSLVPARDQKKPVSPQLTDVLFFCMDIIDKMVVCIKARQPLKFDAELMVLVPRLAAAASATPEIAPIKAPEVTPTMSQPVSEAPHAPTTQASPQATQPPTVDAESSTIRVPVGLLDRLMTLMGEMVLVRNQVLQYANRSDDLEFLNLSQRLNVVTGEIQGEMMKTRMQPIGNVVSKFHRVVRDLAKELGKKIELEIQGAETELDKTLLEAVKDPLTHIIRNSCDHGVEMPDQRRASGKPEEGRVIVHAFHEGGQVIIEIKDDGRGLNRDKLVSKAIEKGILTPEKGAAMSERDAFALIFAAGFSTAAAVTNVSGRGVGMDVVRNNIERIGGSIELESDLGKGMTIRLKIPLTLAIVPAMIIRCNEERYAIPQIKLVELVRVDRSTDGDKIELLQGKPVFRLRGNILPLIDLKGVFNTQSTQDPAGVVNIVVLNAESQCFGLIVDEILDTADIVVKPLSRFLKSLSTYSGATVLGDGSVALILDVAGIAEQQHLGNRKVAEAEQAAATDGRLKSEDSQEFLLFKLDSPTKHALFLGYVHRLEEFKRSMIEYSGGQPVVRYRGAILPIIPLNEYLGYPKPQNETKSDVVPVIVTKKGDHFYGIEVNEILDVLSTDGMVDTTLSDRMGILGSLPTDQEVIVVVDPRSVIGDGPSKRKPEAPRIYEPTTDQDLERMTSAAISGAQGGGKYSILYVEDTAFFRKHVTKVLKEAGHQVTIAINGEEAMKLLDSAAVLAFDMILSDIEMPRMNGLELARAVRASAKWKNTPLMALTTRSENRSVEEGLKAGFDMYLEKMSPPELLGAISQLNSSKGKKGAA